MLRDNSHLAMKFLEFAMLISSPYIEKVAKAGSMYLTLVMTVPFYGVKEDISTGTGRGQTEKDVVDLRGSAFDDHEDTAVKRALTCSCTSTLLLVIFKSML